MVINTNILAQNAASQLGSSSRLLTQSLARLSSGSKINSAEDDAAGLAVSMRVGAQISRTDAAASNVSSAISFSQTQDGYLDKVGAALSRMSELAVEAQDVTKTTSDRVLYDQEFQSLDSYVYNAATKDFNGVSLFSGNALNVTTDSEGSTFQMQGISGNFLNDPLQPGPPVPPTLGTAMTQVVPGFNATWGDVTDQNGNAVWTAFNSATVGDFVNSLNQALTTMNAGSAVYHADGQLSVTVNPGQILTETSSGGGWTPIFSALGLQQVDNSHGASPVTMTTSLSVAGPPQPFNQLGITTLQGAKAALDAVTSAIAQVASNRATVGSNLERLTYTSSQLATLKDNLSASNSQITDVDVAQESTNYSKYNILVQAGTAMLAQANTLPQSVLKLLG